MKRKQKNATIVEMPFKQLRKIGWNFMDENFGQTVARKFGGQNHEGISGAYRADYWADLGEALLEWRKQLIIDEIIPKY